LRRGVALASKKITVVLLPEGTNKVKQFSFPKFLAYLIVFFFLSSAVVLTWLVRDYTDLRARVPSLRKLKAENEYQKKQFAHLTQRIDQVVEKMCDLKEFDRRLKVMVNLETGDDKETLSGVGGSDPKRLKPDYAMVKTHQDLVSVMHKSLDNLNNEIALDKQGKAELRRFLENQKAILASTPSIWPTKGWMTSRFGYRISPFTGEKELHKAIDIAARMNAPVVAPANGIVASVGREHGYGKVLSLSHGYGVVTKYAHLQKILVKKRQYVKRGETIALVGNSGRSTGPHLHYEVRLNGVAVDPERYILN
jgi:murein DD-endopeptidase MepM/ murein hydrolase activator NlpD